MDKIINIKEEFIVNSEAITLTRISSMGCRLSMVRVEINEKGKRSDCLLIRSSVTRPGYIGEHTFFPIQDMEQALAHHRILAKKWKEFVQGGQVATAPTFTHVCTVEEAILHHQVYFDTEI